MREDDFPAAWFVLKVSSLARFSFFLYFHRALSGGTAKARSRAPPRYFWAGLSPPLPFLFLVTFELLAEVTNPFLLT